MPIEPRSTQKPQRGRNTGSAIGREVGGLLIRGLSLLENVRCECADTACGCDGRCVAPAIYKWGSMDEGNLQYLCHRCGMWMVERGTAPGVEQPQITNEKDES